jgi:hypothetical protein
MPITLAAGATNYCSAKNIPESKTSHRDIKRDDEAYKQYKSILERLFSKKEKDKFVTHPPL